MGRGQQFKEFLSHQVMQTRRGMIPAKEVHSEIEVFPQAGGTHWMVMTKVGSEEEVKRIMRSEESGKFLIFSASLEDLIGVAEEEITSERFVAGKVSTNPSLSHAEYCLCLYQAKESDGSLLRDRHPHCKVVGWKSDAQTRAERGL